MNTNYLLASIFSGLVSFACFAQEKNNCDEKLGEAKFLLKQTPIKNKNTNDAIKLLNSCAENDYIPAQNEIAKLFLEGVYVEKNPKKAFQLFKNAAKQSNDEAAYYLGELYKDGIGCKLNFDLAKSWFEKAAKLGNSQAAYALGYLYLKGLGTIEQDYKKAVSWFEMSDYPMAKHWLSVCYYFGYGVNKNQELAIELLLDNPILNSETLVEQFMANKQKDIQLANQRQLASNIMDSTTIASEMVPKKEPKIETTFNPENLSGSWNGKLIEFDWSGTTMNRVVPVSVSIHYDAAEETANYSLKIEDKTIEEEAVWLDDNLYFENLSIQLDRLFTDHPEHKILDYDILSARFSLKSYEGNQYLISTIETSIKQWSEPGPPISLVLRNGEAADTGDLELSEEVISALAAQEDSFIALYPNPFESQLLAQYELEKSGYVEVELYSYVGSDRKVIESGKLQEKGKHVYNIDGSDLSQGLYIIRVKVDGQEHTKMIVKK